MPIGGEFDEAKAALAIEALARGRSPGPIAQALGLTRATLFQWRASNPEFRAAWQHAVGLATDAVEQVLYGAALAGDPTAQKMWLKANAPLRHDRRNLLAAMAIQFRLPGGLPSDFSADDLLPAAAPPAIETAALRASEVDPLAVPLTVRVQVAAEGQRADVWPHAYTGSWPRSVVEMVNPCGVTHTVIADGLMVPADQVADLLALLSAQAVAYGHYNRRLREQAARLAKGVNGDAQAADSVRAARQWPEQSSGPGQHWLSGRPLLGTAAEVGDGGLQPEDPSSSGGLPAGELHSGRELPDRELPDGGVPDGDRWAGPDRAAGDHGGWGDAGADGTGRRAVELGVGDAASLEPLPAGFQAEGA